MTGISKSEVFPLKDVQRGQKCVGYTVFAETKVEPFECEILGVLYHHIGPGLHVVLVKLTDQQTQHTGVVSGMSGSPVFINGKLLGALSYRFGNFPKDPIAGITPMELMYEANRTTQEKVSSKSEISGQPMETPLIFSGVPDSILEAFTPELKSLGNFVVASAGMGSLSSGSNTTVKLENGMAISGLILRGDVVAAATGTATLIDNDILYAFGHMMFGLGSIDMPMYSARVVHTLASLQGSYKIAYPEQEVGTFQDDRITAFVGNTKLRSKMIPVQVKFRDSSKKKNVYQFEVFKDKRWADKFIKIGLASVLSDRIEFESSQALTFEMSVKIKGHDVITKGFHLGDIYGAKAPIVAATSCGQIIELLYKNLKEEVIIESISVSVEHSNYEPVIVTEAWLDTTSAQPGDQITYYLKGKPFSFDNNYFPEKIYSGSFVLPSYLDEGDTVYFRVGTGDDFNQNYLAPFATDIEELNQWIQEIKDPNYVYGVLISKQKPLHVGNTPIPLSPLKLGLLFEKDYQFRNVTQPYTPLNIEKKVIFGTTQKLYDLPIHIRKR